MNDKEWNLDHMAKAIDQEKKDEDRSSEYFQNLEIYKEIIIDLIDEYQKLNRFSGTLYPDFNGFLFLYEGQELPLTYQNIQEAFWGRTESYPYIDFCILSKENYYLPIPEEVIKTWS